MGALEAIKLIRTTQNSSSTTLTISLLGHLGSGGDAGLRPARLVDGDDPEAVLLALDQLLEGDRGGGGVQTLPDLPLVTTCNYESVYTGKLENLIWFYFS